MRPLYLLSLVCGIGSNAAWATTGGPEWSFSELAPACGIDFRHRFGREAFTCIVEDTGAGVALIDYDGDGLLDVYLLNGGWLEELHGAEPENFPDTPDRLYRNLGGMRFEDVTESAGLRDPGYGMGAAVGDYDGDGDEDLYVLDYGPNVLFRNEGDGRFTDVTEEMGVAGPASLSGRKKWSVNGVFFDGDGDGDLDLYVANYLAFDPEVRVASSSSEPYAGPDAFSAQRSILYRNDGSRFTDVTADVGLGAHDMKSMGASVADFDGDGSLDLFEAGDAVPNLLFHKRADGSWREIAMAAGVALDRDGSTMSSMHGTVGDYDGDGRLDLFVPNLEHGCLYRNLGGFRFEEASERNGLARALRGLDAWASQLADFDLDGDVDLLVVTGGTFDVADAQPLKLLRNEDGARFADVSAELGPQFAAPMVGRGAAFGDLDNDGDIDFVVNRKDRGGRASVMQNDLKSSRHWLVLDLEGTRSNRDAIGARVTLVAGGRTLVREVQRSNSYLSQNDPRVHFGLGAAKEVAELRIRWPSGLEQTLEVDAVDRVLRVREPAQD